MRTALSVSISLLAACASEPPPATASHGARARAGERVARLNLAQHFAPQVP